MIRTVLAEKEIEGFDGEVIARGDDRYDEARALWNGMIDKQPMVILRCTSTADVVAAVAFARSHELPVAVRVVEAALEQPCPPLNGRARTRRDRPIPLRRPTNTAIVTSPSCGPLRRPPHRPAKQSAAKPLQIGRRPHLLPPHHCASFQSLRR